MPSLSLPDVHFPELHLPDMNRDDINRALGDARKELGDVRRELDQMRKDIEMPKVDLPKVDLSKMEMPKAVTKAAVSAGLMKKKSSRLPFALGAVVTVAVVGFALANTSSLMARVRELVQSLRERVSGDQTDASDPYAFDAASTMPVRSSSFSDELPTAGSPFDGPSDLPVGLGSDGSNGSDGALGAPDGFEAGLGYDETSRV